MGSQLESWDVKHGSKSGLEVGRQKSRSRSFQMEWRSRRVHVAQHGSVRTMRFYGRQKLANKSPYIFSAILGAEVYDKYVNKHSKHVFGSHMHELVHKHKPDGTHPITEGHLPMHDTIHKHVPVARVMGEPRPGKPETTP